MLEIILQRFKSHHSTSLTLDRLSCLAGPNGSGKSSVFQALTLLSQASAGLRTGLDRFVRQGEQDFRLVLSENPRYFYALTKEMGFKAVVNEGQDLSLKKRASWRLVLHRLNSSRLGEPAYPESIPPTLQADGYGLASVIANLMTSEPELFESFTARLKQVLPWVKRVRTRPAKVLRSEKRTVQLDGAQAIEFDQPREVIGQELLLDTAYAQGLPSSNLSDGTLLVMGVLATLSNPTPPDLIMLDDIEQGLHPSAQRQLISVLRTCVEKVPDLRIAVTTHSPYVVDEFKPEEVWVFNLDHQGATVVKQLSKHPDAARALEVLTTGEFLAAEGEEWVKK